MKLERTTSISSVSGSISLLHFGQILQGDSGVRGVPGLETLLVDDLELLYEGLRESLRGGSNLGVDDPKPTG